MPEGGALTIDTAETSGDDESPAVSVTVCDSGTGMEAGILASVLEPFFTTKPLGQGTGLGLPMVYGFVKQSRGDVHIDSAVGTGTAVTLRLPGSPPEQAAAADEVVQGETGGDGRVVLVVEDDPQVRMLILEVLRDLQFRAIEASDPERAIAVLEEEGHIDLLVSDVGLPGMNGRRLAEIARRRGGRA